jgi:2-octaprenylphenol hydroxylase
MKNASSAPRKIDVAVVGTGLVGLAAAVGFASRGFQVALVGPAPAAPAVPTNGFDARIYAIAPATQRLLAELRVWQAMDAQRLTAVESMQVFGDGTRPGTVGLSSYSAALPELCWIVEHQAMQQALLAACSFQRTIERFDSPFEALLAGAESQARVFSLADGRTVAAELLVAADGADSPVRQALGIAATRRPYDELGVVANFRCERPHRHVAHQWFRPDGVIALLPLPGDHVSLVWSAPRAVADTLLGLDEAVFAERVADACGRQLGGLQSVGGRQAFPLALLKVERVIGERVALVGDSAHVVHPLAGQGLNLGMQDVAALLDATTAREAFRGIGDERVLRRYERNRREAVFALQWATDGLHQLFGLPHPMARWARNAGMNLVDKLPVLKRKLIEIAAGR